jgi:hypothetical protein
MVFDTGQVLFGLIALAAEDRDDGCLSAARRAGEWLLAQQDPDGSWVRHAYRGIPHTYYSRVSWALILLSRLSGIERFGDAARSQLRWVLSRQHEDGWFSECSFSSDERPILHVIAYTIRGLWESSLLLGDASMEAAARVAAEELCRQEKGRGWLESHFGPGWHPLGGSVCLTGLAQTAVIWLRMADRYGKDDFRQAAVRCLDFLRHRQLKRPGVAELNGTLPGSAPLWGEYFPWSFPNWGTKFFVDGLLAQLRRPGHDAFAG